MHNLQFPVVNAAHGAYDILQIMSLIAVRDNCVFVNTKSVTALHLLTITLPLVNVCAWDIEWFPNVS